MKVFKTMAMPFKLRKASFLDFKSLFLIPKIFSSSYKRCFVSPLLPSFDLCGDYNE